MKVTMKVVSNAHLIFSGQVYCSKLPRPIPVYMTLQVAPAVGVIGGTEEDFRKILADIEEQMIGGTTEVEDYDGRWLPCRFSFQCYHHSPTSGFVI